MLFNVVRNAKIFIVEIEPISEFLGDFAVKSEALLFCKHPPRGLSISLCHFHLSKVIFGHVSYAEN